MFLLLLFPFTHIGKNGYSKNKLGEKGKKLKKVFNYNSKSNLYLNKKRYRIQLKFKDI